MSSPPRDLRLFVAVYPPALLALDMLGAARALALPPHRETPAAQVHMTLAFLGHVPLRTLDQVRESVARSVSGLPRFTLTPTRLCTFPLDRSPPRLVALETDAPPPVLELVRRLAARLAHHPRHHPADRFLPHLTLARFDHASRADPFTLPAAVQPFLVDRVHLMRSTLRPQGAEHEPVDSFLLD
jgi:2'-5' RNA ligase